MGVCVKKTQGRGVGIDQIVYVLPPLDCSECSIHTLMDTFTEREERVCVCVGMHVHVLLFFVLLVLGFVPECF